MPASTNVRVQWASGPIGLWATETTVQVDGSYVISQWKGVAHRPKGVRETFVSLPCLHPVPRRGGGDAHYFLGRKKARFDFGKGLDVGLECYWLR